MSAGFTPELCIGQVMHQRDYPAQNRFVYPMFFLRLPLSQLPSLKVPLLGINRCNLLRLDFRDHGARDGSDPLLWARRVLSEHGVADITDGEVVLHTFPRVMGYVFNPVSFFYCHDRAGTLRVVLAEVSNTFGERHNYIVAHPDGRPLRSEDTLTAKKVFHVSPFFPVSGEYRFRFANGAYGVDGTSDNSGVGGTNTRFVSIDYFDHNQRVLATSVGGRAQPLTGRTLRAAIVRFPFLTLGVIMRIHLQALRLWRLRVPFYRKPQPPIKETTR